MTAPVWQFHLASLVTLSQSSQRIQPALAPDDATALPSGRRGIGGEDTRFHVNQAETASELPSTQLCMVSDAASVHDMPGR